jgi:hypothetical protein
VRANAILPGSVTSDRLHPALAALALFLSAPAAQCLTGQVFRVDAMASAADPPRRPEPAQAGR